MVFRIKNDGKIGLVLLKTVCVEVPISELFTGKEVVMF